MLTFHGGYIAAALGTLRPPSKVKAVYIVPGGAGSWSGDDWANAAPLHTLNSMIDKAAAMGAEVWLRADAGPYSQTSVLTITKGYATIRGVDVNGLPMKAQIVGNRPAPWTVGAAYGSELFRLNSGADNLTFRHLEFRDLGAGCVRLRQPIANLTVEDCDAYNVGRVVAVIGATSSADASVNGLTVRRVNGYQLSRAGINMRFNTRNVLIEDCLFDFANIDGDFIAVGISGEHNTENVVIRRVRVINVLNSGPGRYFNGDAFSNERGCDNWLLEDCSAENISDGAIDFKGDNIHVLRFQAKFCKRSFRIWGDTLLEACDSDTPRTRGGTGATCHVIANPSGKTRVRIKGGTFKQPGTMPIFRGSDQSLIAWDQAALNGISAPAGTPIFSLDISDDFDALTTLWDHGDATAPVINTPLAFTLPENRPGEFLLSFSEPCNFRVRGPDAGKVAAVGRTLAVRAQDFEKPGGVAADGSDTLKFEIQAYDPNDNASPWHPVTVLITDVADDPITAAQAVAASGATDGFWYDVAVPTSLWADDARTIQAEIGDVTACLDDLTGFGNHCRFPEAFQPILLLNEKGYRYLAFTGAEYGKIGTPGDLRFAQLTSFFVFQRDKGDYDPGVSSTSVLMSSGRRNLTDQTSSNSMFAMEVVDTSFARVRTASASIGLNAGFDHSGPHVLSYRSTDGQVRSDGSKVAADGTDIAAIAYARSGEQPTLGARYNHLGVLVAFIEGRFTAAAMLNRALDDDTRFRVERQLAGSAGKALV